MRSYTLAIGGEVNTGKENVEWELVLENINKLTKQQNKIDYLILSPSLSASSDKCLYIKLMYAQSSGKFIVEAAFDYTRYIYKTANAYEVQNIMQDYMLKSREPDVDVWGWECEDNY